MYAFHISLQMAVSALLLASPNQAKKLQQGLFLPLLPDPQQPPAARINLIDQCRVHVPLLSRQFIDPNGFDAVEVAVLKTPVYRLFHRPK